MLYLCLVSWLACLAIVSSPAPDTLVVCPTEIQPGLHEWLEYRRAQGHVVEVSDSSEAAAAVQNAIREAHSGRRLRYVLLVGMPVAAKPDGAPDSNAVKETALAMPTNYARAKVNARWGRERWIATDLPYADFDGDNTPDVAIGRIPATTAVQLSATLKKTIAYEQSTEQGPWQQRLNVASCPGGFGTVVDGLIEASARQVFTQLVPPQFELRHIQAGSNAVRLKSARPISIDTAAKAQQALCEGCMAWVYIGHGHVTQLDRVRTPNGNRSILAVNDVPNLKCGGRCPLAVLMACYTGAFDSQRSCLARELLLAPGGPVAVVAASRVSMPYGNTVLGSELLKACFTDRPEHAGDLLRSACRRTNTPLEDDALRKSLESIAAGISPQPIDLAQERCEHVQMYHFFGDPLLRLKYPRQNDTPDTKPL